MGFGCSDKKNYIAGINHNQLFVKLAPVLLKYLAANQSLNLPGLGIFRADGTYDPDIDYNKKGVPLPDISFEQAKITGLDEELVNFVSKETGKMKVLAQSDLMSELDGVLHFLNTGKPYYIPGIGTLTKKMDGSFDFHKDKHPVIEKEKRKPLPAAEKIVIPQTYIDDTPKTRKFKPALIILTLCVLAVAATVWFYVKNSEQSARDIEDLTSGQVASEIPAGDTASASTTVTPTAVIASPDGYKYVLETARQPRASKRYNQLKALQWPVEIETADSVNFKLFMKLPAANADTTRIKDSLSVLSGRKVWIER